MPGANDEEWPLPSQTSVGQALAAKKNGMAEGGKVSESCKYCGGGMPHKMAEGGPPDETQPDVSGFPQGRAAAPEAAPVDPEKPIISEALKSANDWLMADPNKPVPESFQPKPADVAATTADANVDALKAKEDAAENIADAAHTQAAQQASIPSPEGLATRGLQAETAGAAGTAAAQGALGQEQAKAMEANIARQQDIQNQFQKSVSSSSIVSARLIFLIF